MPCTGTSFLRAPGSVYPADATEVSSWGKQIAYVSVRVLFSFDTISSHMQASTPVPYMGIAASCCAQLFTVSGVVYLLGRFDYPSWIHRRLPENQSGTDF